MADADAEKVSLDPDSVSFMEALAAREHGETSAQNGFSPGDGEDCEDAPKGDDKAKTSAAPEQTCPVELHKAVLLYPSLTPSVTLHTCEDDSLT